MHAPHRTHADVVRRLQRDGLRYFLVSNCTPDM